MCTYFAGENVAERGKRVVEGLVVDLLVQVLDENIADAVLSKRRVAVRPHNSHRSVLQQIEIHCVERAIR